MRYATLNIDRLYPHLELLSILLCFDDTLNKSTSNLVRDGALVVGGGDTEREKNQVIRSTTDRKIMELTRTGSLDTSKGGSAKVRTCTKSKPTNIDVMVRLLNQLTVYS